MVSVPSVQMIEFVSKNTKGTSISYEELKLLVLQDEAIWRQSGAENKDVRAAMMVRKENIRCYECQDLGHIGAHCPNKGMGKLCYKCNKFGRHIASEFPNEPTSSSNASRGRGIRRGNFQFTRPNTFSRDSNNYQRRGSKRKINDESEIVAKRNRGNSERSRDRGSYSRVFL